MKIFLFCHLLRLICSLITPHTIFDHIYVANLASRPGRMGSIKRTLKHLNISFERIQAVNGNTTQNRRIFNILKLKGAVFSSSGSFGTAETFLHAIRDAKRKKFKCILWLEDDAVFHRQFEKNFDERMALIDEKWTFLFLGSTMKSKPNFRIRNGYFKTELMDGTFSLGISFKAFDELISLLENHVGVIDTVVVSNICRRRNHTCLVMYPPLVVADVRTSNIEPERIKGSIISGWGEKEQRRYLWKMGVRKRDFPLENEYCSVTILLKTRNQLGRKRIKTLLKKQSFNGFEIIDIPRDFSFKKLKGIFGSVNGKWIYLTDGGDIRGKDFMEKTFLDSVCKGEELPKGKFIFLSKMGDEKLIRKIGNAIKLIQ